MRTQFACAFADGAQTHWTCVTTPTTPVVTQPPRIILTSEGLTATQTVGFGVSIAFVLVCALALGRRLAR